jgi:16S rRNA (cytidine1402-2'-O)-methyltransferase
MQEFNSDIKNNDLSSGLHVVSTPIGNLGDITLRAINTLKNSDFVICEDSRVSGSLLNKLDIKKPFIIYNDYSNSNERQKILNLLIQGKKLALISDAGTPLISDPGYKLVSFLREKEIAIFSVPGACSAIAALSISGIASDRFMFVGFIPNTKASRNTFLKDLTTTNASLIFFESNKRLAKSLESMLEIFGNRNAAVIREITKLYEETKKAPLKDLVEYYQKHQVKGEIVIVVSAFSSKDKEVDWKIIDQELKSGLKTIKPKDLVSMVAHNYCIDKKVIYQRMLLAKERGLGDKEK